LSVKYQDGHTEKITIEREELTKIAARTSISAEDLKNLQRSQQLPFDPPASPPPQQPKEKSEEEEKQ
jgi:hypothetical protein